MIEETLIFLKPDALAKQVIPKITERLYGEGQLILKYSKLIRITEEQAREHYKHVSHMEFFEDMIKFITSDIVVVMVLEGEDAINRTRTLLGSTRNAPKGTIRGDYGSDGFCNLMHASGSKEEYEDECRRLVPEYLHSRVVTI